MDYHKNISFLMKGILAGVIISLSMYLSLISNNTYLGYLLFPVVIFTTIKTKSCLYTINIGKLRFSKESIYSMFFIFIGNVIGTMLLIPFYKESYLNIFTLKLTQSGLDIFGKSFFFGILLYIGVYFSEMNSLYMYMIIFSILFSKYEHCIPNVGWMMITHSFTLSSLKLIAISTLGNTLGAIFMDRLSNSKYIKNIEKKDTN